MKRAIGMLMTARDARITPISLIANVSGGSSDTFNVTTSAIDTSNADFLVMVVAYFAAVGLSGVSDSKSNTWLPLTVQSTGLSVVGIFYCENPIVGSGHTFSSLNGGATFPSIAVAAFKNVKLSSAFDQENGAIGSGTTIQTGNVTPSLSNELIIAGLAFNATSTVSIDSSFNITDTTDFSSGLHFGVSLAYKIKTAATSENPTFTLGSSNSAIAAAIATFKHN